MIKILLITLSKKDERKQTRQNVRVRIRLVEILFLYF